MAQIAEEIVGRAAELATLDRSLDRLARRRPGAVGIVGEPGIGKTRLLLELGARAHERGHLVLSGSAAELEGNLPFGVFVDALDEYVGGLEPRRLDALGEEDRAELAQVLPSIGPRAGTTLQIERYRIHRAARLLLEELAPLVLLLDDLHWADSGSAELLGMLLRRPPAAPVLLALAVRPRQMPERLGAAVARAERAGTLDRVELGALAAGEVRELLGGAVGDGESEALHRESGGNPFYLQELARGARRPTAAAAPALAGLEVPRSVAAALTGELALLDDATRRVLEGAAVAGDPFEPELAAAAAGADEAAAMAALDELLRRDLVRPTDVPRRFRFRHPLVRAAIYEATPGGWRLGAHERAAGALAARGAPAPARAHHVEHAARHGDAAAIAVLREAGEAVAAQAPGDAARWFAAARRLLPATAPAGEIVPVLTALANACAATGRLDEARAALLDGLEVAPPGERVGLVVACAEIEQVLGRHGEARRRLEQALRGLPDGGSADAAALMIELSVVDFYAMDLDGAHAWAQRALDVATALGERPLMAAGAAAAALALAYGGRRAEAEGYRERAAWLVDAMADAELAQRLDAAAHLSGAEGYLDRFAEGLAHAERGIAVARATGQGQLFPVLIPALTIALFGLGRLREAAEHLDGAIEGDRLAGMVQPLAWSLLSLASVQLMFGDFETALRTAEESVELCRDLEVSALSSYAGEILGLVLIELGETERGIATLTESGGGDALPLSPGSWRAWDLDRLTAGRLALGRRDEAARAAAHATEMAQATGLRFAGGLALRARARVALDAGDATGAAELALASAAALTELGTRVEAALSRGLAGRALAAAGERERAVAELSEAAAALDRAGAERSRAEAERDLRRLGRHGPARRSGERSDAAGLESLSSRELEVARLIVDRRTNAQIASELFISQKTVETHVRNLFFKLSVSSRVDIARAVERAERDA
jgi:predicted ATPase/DNA-binding NarL/FixJ family response regulator